VPVNFRPDLTAFIGPEMIPVEMIERVEVARGPLSALYGANAFLATVNVVTRTQAGSRLMGEVTGRAFGRTGGTGFGGSVVAGYGDGSQSAFLSAVGEQLDRSGLSVSPTFAAQDPTLPRYQGLFGVPSQNDRTLPRGVYGQYTYGSASGPLGTFGLQGGLQRHDAMGEFQLNSVLTHDSRWSVENDWASLRHEKAWSQAVTTSVWLAASRGAPTGDEQLTLTGNTSSWYARHFGYQALDGAGELQLSPLDSLQIKAGVDFSYELQSVLYYSESLLVAQGARPAGSTVDLIGAQDTRAVTLKNRGAYLQVGVTLPGNLRLTANGRMDLPNLFPTQYSWRAVVAKRWNEQVTSKLIAGRAFQTPSATLLFGLPGFGSSNNLVGNGTLQNTPALIPQTVQSVEMATSIELLGRMAVELAVYAQQVDHSIEFTQAGSNFEALNRGQQRGAGAEISIHLVFGRLSAQLSGELLGTITDTGLSFTPPPLYPCYRVSGGAHWELPQLHVALGANVTGTGERGSSQSNTFLNNDVPYSLPAYARVDASISTLGVRVLGAVETVLAVTVHNALDDRTPEPGFGGLDVPTLGRLTMLELRQAY